MAFVGQALAQWPQAMHSSGAKESSGFAESDSGLWHQRQRNGQPLKKTVVRMPGPSWMEKRWMSKIVPVAVVMVEMIVSFLNEMKTTA